MSDSSNSVDAMQTLLGQLNSQIVQLQEKLQVQSIEIADLQDRIPDSNIISPKFINRAFAVWGHYFVAGFIITIPFIGLISLFALVMNLISQSQ